MVTEARSRSHSPIKKENIRGIVLAAHPYHIDPAINHGLPEEIIRLGMAVLTEDSICSSFYKIKYTMEVVNQWTYHSRLYRAAEVVKEHTSSRITANHIIWLRA